MDTPTIPQSRLTQLLASLQDINTAIAQTDQQLDDALGQHDDLAQAIADFNSDLDYDDYGITYPDDTSDDEPGDCPACQRLPGCYDCTCSN